ncbi:putative RNA polymerase sigma factor FecI [compost metagenome]|jgi:RNA polymerase sigma-70 factor (ECF subfamily)
MDVIDWLALEILPHEAEARDWIRAAAIGPEEEDDLIQEVYCRLLEVEDVSRIGSPRAFLFQTVRAAIQDHLRQTPVVRIDISNLMDKLIAPEALNSPEMIAHDRRLLAQVRQAMEALPGRCREVFELRKLWGLTQKDVARRLNISEKAVESETTRGLRLLMQAMADKSRAPRTRGTHGPTPSAGRHRLGSRRLGGQGRRRAAEPR